MKNLKLAICKPDHLGDFVLALPAIRQLRQACGALTLFIASSNFAIADHHFTGIEKVAVDLPYLSGRMPTETWAQVYGSLGKLKSFDAVLFMRSDRFLNPTSFAQWTDSALFIEDRNDIHQTRLEHAAVSKLIGPYDVEATFNNGHAKQFPIDPKLVVFAPGSGFPHKKWSPLHWSQLGQMLQGRDIQLRILSGPLEAAESGIIARSLGLSENDVFLGGGDFGLLETWLDECDVVIAADGGSAHLAATRKPVLAVFGPSPLARYAPIGVHNRVVTRNLSCSPCAGFDARLLNACMTRECLYGLQPRSVFDALFLPSGAPGDVYKLDGPDRAEVHFGLSSAPSPL